MAEEKPVGRRGPARMTPQWWQVRGGPWCEMGNPHRDVTDCRKTPLG